MTAIMIPAIDAEGRFTPVEKMDAHRRGVLHQAISVFVTDGDRLLIQRRAAAKYHCGGLWANTVCSHPHFGEDPAAAAARRLREELGVEGLPLTATGVFDYRADVGGGLTEHERVHMFRADADAGALVLHPDPAEVDATRWISRAGLLAELAAHPAAFTPWFRIYLARWPGFDFGRAA
ncbi:MAG: isopentenyl-diphosphate Delta-isomerase [Rubrimonas sp.]